MKKTMLNLFNSNGRVHLNESSLTLQEKLTASLANEQVEFRVVDESGGLLVLSGGCLYNVRLAANKQKGLQLILEQAREDFMVHTESSPLSPAEFIRRLGEFVNMIPESQLIPCAQVNLEWQEIEDRRKFQRGFVQELAATIVKKICEQIDGGKIPMEWDGHELRVLLAEKTEESSSMSTLRSDKRRFANYVNVVRVNQL